MALATLGGLGFGLESALASGSMSTIASRGATTFANRPLLNTSARPAQTLSLQRNRDVAKFQAPQVAAIALDLERPTANVKGSRNLRGPGLYVEQESGYYGQSGHLPDALYKLLDANESVDLPAFNKVHPRCLDNRELDKLVGNLGRSKLTWRRALLLHEWLLGMGHLPDDRLCTTLIRVCSQHGQALTALNLYDWMRARQEEGGAALVPTVFTYTAAMRAALAGNLLDRAVKVWEDAMTAGCEPDCRLCTTMIEVCARRGDTAMALALYERMRKAPKDSRMAPSVHAYTAAMRAAAEGGQWERALDIWKNMAEAGCRPTGHAYAAVISACAAGGAWVRAQELFSEMVDLQIKPDVVSCTALITALGTDGQWQRAEKVVEWMVKSGVRPNVRTYTALITAMGNAQEWSRALETIRSMKSAQPWGSVEPNAYTYSALLKTMGEQGQWQLAEAVFADLEAECTGHSPADECSADHFLGPAEDGAGWFASSRDPASPVIWTPLAPGFSVPPQAGSPWDLTTNAMAQRMRNLSVAEASTSQAVADQEAGRQQNVASHSGFNPLAHYGITPRSLAEQVLQQPQAPSNLALQLPDDLPGQSNVGELPSEPFSYFSAAARDEPPASTSGLEGVLSRGHQQRQQQQQAWTSNNAAVSGLQLVPNAAAQPAAAHYVPALDLGASFEVEATGASKWGLEMRGQDERGKAALRGGANRGKGPLNEVVCGALMLAYERAGKWEQAVTMLERSRKLGIQPNTIMYNTAISALGKAGHWKVAEQLFNDVGSPDAVSFETLIAAYGISGQAMKAEDAFRAMQEAGHTPRDYAYCGLIAAHSIDGNWRDALRVRSRMIRSGAKPTVHVYNALIAACERVWQWDAALDLYRCMVREGLAPNPVTHQLMTTVSQRGSAAVEEQQAVASALSAAVCAAGTFFLRSAF